MEQLVARWAHNPKVVGSSPTPATRRNLARKCRVFLFQGVRLAYKPWSKKALKERSDSRFLLVKHPLLDSLGRRPGNTTPATTNPLKSLISEGFSFVADKIAGKKNIENQQ